MNYKRLVVLIVAMAFLNHSCGKKIVSDEKLFAGMSIKIQTALMPDSNIWMIENLNVVIRDSYCQENDSSLCNKYGRLYTWQSAKKGCELLGEGWRLPTNEEWQRMAKYYGGVLDDSNDRGQSAYGDLMVGGSSGFNALLGGNREANGHYERLEAHGFYWTSSEYDSAEAWFYNFGKGSNLLNHHTGDKQRAISVRCIKANE